MDDAVIARAVHVLAVVLWIGGVAMVTTVVLPAARRFATPEEGFAFLKAIERRFAAQARATTLITGLSGLYMVWRYGLWERFVIASYWWMDAMVGVWLIFSAMLFVIEPVFLDHWIERRARQAPVATLARVQRLHWLLLTLSVVTILGAVAGTHGLLLFE
jgi:uncharacterized membrane protein